MQIWVKYVSSSTQSKFKSESSQNSNYDQPKSRLPMSSVSTSSSCLTSHHWINENNNLLDLQTQTYVKKNEVLYTNEHGKTTPKWHEDN